MTEIRQLGLDGVLLVTPTKHRDGRGFFSEVYNKRSLEEHGIKDVFVQDNHSLSATVGTVRGIHFQVPPMAIAKLVRVVKGGVWDVVVDLRVGSPTYGNHVAAELTAENWAQIYVPPGFGHGFCTIQPDTEVAYKVTDYWSPDVDKGVAWDDPDLAIPWPVEHNEAVVSDKDQAQPAFADLPPYFEASR